MARKPFRSSGVRMPFSASSIAPARKPKPKSKRKLDPSNAYTYLPSLPKRHRTSEVTLSLSHDELKSQPSRRRHEDDDAEDDGMDERIKKVAMMIAEEGPGEVESGESDVDSDQAWEGKGSDEERWGDLFRGIQKGKSLGQGKPKEVVRKPTKPLTVDLDESDDEETADTKSRTTAVRFSLPKANDLADNAEEEEEDEEDSELEGDDSMEGIQELEDAEQDEEDGEDEDEPSDLSLPSDLSEDGDDPDALDDLDSFVDQLASADKKRKVGDQRDLPVEAPKKRRVLPVMRGPSLNDAGDLGLKNNQKIDIATLIASHPALSGASALLPSKADKNSSSSILNQGVLPAPLPTVVQERLDREAAYEKTKEEGAKWAGVMKRIKEAEHLSFPLQASDRGGVKSSGEMLAGFKPENKRESAVHALLQRANLTDASMAQKEDQALEAQELSIEEIAARRDNLRQQRELMFRAESRAKRVAKIKSKTFRKLARKRQERAGGDVDLDYRNPEEADEEREKLERARAVERATLRHGARNGRWARDFGGDGGEIEDRRRAKEDMLDIKERLQRKIMGREDGEAPSSEDDDDDVGDDAAAIKNRAFDQLAGLDANEPAEEAGQGLMQMAFMKKAREREMRKVAEDEQDLRRYIELFGDEDNGSDEEEEDGDEMETAQVMRVEGNEGRMVFSGPISGTSAPAVPATPATASTPLSSLPARPRSPSLPPDHNPWLVPFATAGPSRKRNTAAPRPVDKASRDLKMQANKDKNAAVDDERVDISIDGPALLRANGHEEDSDDDELLPVSGIKAFKQRDLVAEAFAGDNVVEDFARDKQRQVEDDAPKIEDTTIPGWGSWGGKGVKKRRTDPRLLIKKDGIEPATRKDFTRSNVIINERKDKRAHQYLVKDLPYPYMSVAQYERNFDTPLGSEWNARGVHQRETMPRVVKKPGAIIEPVRRLF